MENDEYILLANNKKIKKYSVEYLIWFYSKDREKTKEEDEAERTKRALKLKPNIEPEETKTQRRTRRKM